MSKYDPLWIWIGGIGAVKLANIVFCFVCRRRFAAVHTVMNKLTGFLLFLLPLTLAFVKLSYSAVPVCAAATLAAMEEWHYIANKFK